MNTVDDRPRIAITLGDPAGIGPEVIVAAWRDAELHERCRPLVVGRPEIVRRAVDLLAVDAEVVEIDSPEEAAPGPHSIPCLASGCDAALDVAPGTVTAAGGQAAYDALVLASELAMAGRVAAITTAPLSKAALWKAGHEYPGHTELLGELCGGYDTAMMLYLPPGEAIRGRSGLGVVHVTLHTALSSVFAEMTTERIVSRCHLADQVLGCFGNARPRLAVCALNPHAGEDGLFGDEEQTIIAPAVEQARDAGLLVEGPLPADTLMVRGRDGEFDGAVAMYHDQGHIALKLLGMHRAVNITLGLPIIRTSVAHGTAIDRAWRGEADHHGMLAALSVAGQLAAAGYGSLQAREM